jgi:hypothetical protein
MMSERLNAAVVLAALDDMLEPMTTHCATHLSVMRHRVERLREHVAQYVEPELADSGREDER